MALHELLQKGILSGEVRPLPLTIFASEKAEDAFRYMATGGKLFLKCMYQQEKRV